MNTTPNDLLERYLRAIGQYLPLATRADTLAELQANLLEQMDARAEELRRPLSVADVADLVRRHGRPESVAARYLTQRSLIGPALFPSYLYTLRKALPIVVLIYAVVECIRLVTAPGGPLTSSQIVHAVLWVFPTLFSFWAWITLTFAFLEYTHARHGLGKKWTGDSNWDPTKLPPVKAYSAETKRKSTPALFADLIVHILWMLYVLAIPTHPFLALGPAKYFLEGIGARFAPVWQIFFIVLVICLLVQLATKFLAVVDIYPEAIPALEISSDLLSVVSTGVMVFATEYFIAAGDSADPEVVAQINHGLTISFRIAFAFAIIGLFNHGWKTAKTYFRNEPLAL